MTDALRSVAVLAPMPSELRPVIKAFGLAAAGGRDGAAHYSGRLGAWEVTATLTGIGPELAEEATRRVLATTEVDHLIVCGIAGGIAPVSAVSDLLIPAEAVDRRSGERFGATPIGDVTPSGVISTGDADDYNLDDAAIAALREQGVTALDMETAAIARVCAAHEVPWLAFRAISDMAGDASLGAVVMSLVDAQGNPRVGAAVRYLVTHPHKILRMAGLGRDASRAATIAARAARAALPGAPQP